MSAIDVRVDSFCRRFGLELPILLAPMAGASAPALSIAVMQAGGLGACGALLMQPDEIAAWADEVRAKGSATVPAQPVGARSAAAAGRRSGTAATCLPQRLGASAGGGRRRCQAAGLRRSMRSSAGGRAADRLVGDGSFSERVRCQAEARWHRLVCECLDRGRSAGGGGRWRRRDRRPRDGGGRTSRVLRCLPGRTSAGRIVRVDTCGGGRGRGAGGRDRRDRRRTWSCRGAGARRERRADRIRIPALPRGGRPPRLGRSAGSRCARGHNRHQRVQRPRRAKRRHHLRAGSDRRSGPAASTVPGSTRTDECHACASRRDR